ncbi:MAG: hypothetical protein J6Z25_00460 [Opitutales bacterium]|nr:hypothetical protein [Opitutales bacterium]
MDKKILFSKSRNRFVMIMLGALAMRGSIVHGGLVEICFSKADQNDVQAAQLTQYVAYVNTNQDDCITKLGKEIKQRYPHAVVTNTNTMIKYDEDGLPTIQCSVGEDERIIMLTNVTISEAESGKLFKGIKKPFKIVFSDCKGTLAVNEDFRDQVESVAFINNSKFTISKDCFKGAPRLHQLEFTNSTITATQDCFAELSNLETLKCRLFEFMPPKEGKQSQHQVILNAFRGTPIIPQIPENGQNSMISALKENTVDSFTQTSNFENEEKGTEEEKDAIIQQLKKQIETLKTEHRKKVTNIEQDFRQQKISAQKKHSAQVANIEKQHKIQIETLKKKLEANTQRLENTNLVRDLKKTVSDLQDNIKQKEKEKAELEQKVRTLQRKFEKLQDTLRQYIHGGNEGNNLNNNENDAPGANIDAGAAPAI